MFNTPFVYQRINYFFFTFFNFILINIFAKGLVVGSGCLLDADLGPDGLGTYLLLLRRWELAAISRLEV